MVIYFYTPGGEYGALSNFSSYGIEMDGRYWSTVEHYFQAQKFPGHVQQQRIWMVRTPKQAKALGRDRSMPIREDWETVKDSIMRDAVLKKFETHASAREILLSTKEAELVESSPSDYYWGCGADGSGLNKLGIILMEVRSILQNNVAPIA